MLKPLIILNLLVFYSLCLFGQTPVDKSFQSSINTFLDKCLSTYLMSAERNAGEGNDYILDTKAKTTWKKTVTLKSKRSFVNKYKQTVYPKLYLGFYQFGNQKEANDAFNTLLNCLGGDCTKVEWGQYGASVKSPPFIYIFNQKEFVVCHVKYEHINDRWDSIQKDLIKTFSKRPSKVMRGSAPLSFTTLN